MPRKRTRDAQPDDTSAVRNIPPTSVPAPQPDGAYDARIASGDDEAATMRFPVGQDAQAAQNMQGMQDAPYTIPPTGSPTGANTRARRTLGDTIHHLPMPSQPTDGVAGGVAGATPMRPTRPPRPSAPPASMPPTSLPPGARSRRPTRPTLTPGQIQRTQRPTHYDEAGLVGLDIFTTDERRAVMGGDNLPSATPAPVADAPQLLAERPTLQVAQYGAANLPAGGETPQPAHQALTVVPDAASRALATRGEDAAAPLLIRGASRAPAPWQPIVPPRRNGRRSFITQFVIAMISAAVLLTTLTLASPLGRITGISDSFQAYANAVPIPPTPTPTPKPKPQYSPPTGSNPGQQVIINDIVAVFGSYSSGALAVARCESGYDPNARNPYAIGNSHAEGVFQILYPSTWDGTSYHSYSPYNYDANIHAAHEIFARDGYTWREWQCQP